MSSGAVRQEDAFDVTRVTTWLRAQVPDDLAAELEGDPQVRQFNSGASNLTYELRWPTRALVLRRPPHGALGGSAHNMRREHDLQAALGPVYPHVPGMVALCTDDSVLGSDFYVMDKLEGAIVGKDLPDGLSLTPEQARALCDNALAALIELHEVDVSTVPALADLDRGEGYVHRQVEGWIRRYRAAATDDVPDFEDVMVWLVEHEPADRPHALIHNDFRLDNLVLDPDDPTLVVGVLDWELATVGDPLMDLGGALAYWAQADDDETMRSLRLQPTNLPGMLTRAEIVERYCAARGLQVSEREWAFYEVFGLFRLAGIAQQIYQRYRAGSTTNPRFAVFGPMVTYLDARCRSLIG
ncbi:aminoglycoside phosphotransferase [Janibacter sp. Soil728]|uniref:phosphotransferase family protein n=1 Tax=Janibacter sp. Soil728 TaxID=1736393 RepID=UPI0006F72A5D|nr:phosphotransferase family protein [Janibacter sp. Soil728]KRE38949.1 aminoglycoside phosphotransferase [Janibacter sp. Soil728]